MANRNSVPEEKRPNVAKEEEKVRKPYVKPAFRFEQVFVSSALTCGKIDSTEFLCRHNRKVS
jgi:hypothetical protein